MKRIRFRLCPELSDGSHKSIVTNIPDVVAAVDAWCEYAEAYQTAGESCTIETVLMSDAEVEALPDI